MTVQPTAELTIDLGALVANYRLLQSRAAPAAVAAAIKADAYGLGAAEAAPALARAGCRRFFVALLSEAVALRPIVPEADIYVLSGPLGGDEGEFAQRRLTPILNSLPQIERWSHWCATHGPQPAGLHVDTGMARLGLAPAELDRLAAAPAPLAFPVPLVMSHLACADEPRHPQNVAQLAAFRIALDRLLPLLPAPPLISFANSSGIFLGADYAFDLVRPGAALYGLNPLPAASNPMRQVVGLQARILQVRHIDAHQTVGYGAAHRSERATILATLGLGYADGVFRALSHVGAVYVGGIRAPFVGRVSMDLITIDVGHVPAHLAQPGAWVEILGAHQSADDLAAAAGTIGYEVLTALGPRLRRRYIPA